MTNRQRNSFIIMILILAVVFMGVGYSLLSEKLEVSGTTTLVPEKNVKIQAVTYSLTDGAKNVSEPTFEGTSVYFNVELQKPGDMASYRIALGNTGKTDIRITDVIAATPANPFIFEVHNIAPGEIVPRNSTKEINVLIGWDESSTEIVESTITENFGLDIRFTN